MPVLDREVQSGETVRLDGGGSDDSDGSIASWAWTRTGGTGDDTVVLSGEDTARLSFTADTLPPGDPDVTHVFSLVVTDNADAESVADTVTVTVRSMNFFPVAEVGPDRTVQSGETVTLDVSRSYDRDGTIVRFAWTGTIDRLDDRKLPLENADTATPSFMAPALAPGDEDLRILFQLIIWDNEGDSDLGFMWVTVTAPNVPPVADAGLDQAVFSGETVRLDGSGSEDSDGSIVSYQWRRTGGSGNRDVVLSGADTAELSFTADTLAVEDADATHVFQLVVEDDEGAFGISEVTVTVTAPNVSPIANAGADQTVASGAAVQLDGSASSDRGGTIATYEWSWTSGTGEAVRLTGADSVRPGFMADRLDPGAADVTHVFTLIVTDDEGAFDFDTVTVTVGAAASNTAPTANAGADQTATPGATVRLDGSGSMDNEGSIASYSWTRTGGTTGRRVTLSGSKTAQPSFTADTLFSGAADVTHVFSLVVTDEEGVNSIADEVTVTVIAPNAVPVANAGPDQTVRSGATVQLDGSASTSDRRRTIASHAWSRTDGTSDDTVALSDANVSRPSFTADTLTPGAADVTHVFSLVVTDNEDAESFADTVTVTVVSNTVPVANAGPDQTVAPGAAVQLMGSGTDDDGTVGAYSWRRTGGTGDAAVVLSGENTAQLSFTADTLASGVDDATHIFTLVVTDNEEAESVADTVTVTVTAGNVPPVADAGSDREVQSGETVRLDGSGSDDSDGSIASWAWTRTGGTGDDTVVLSGEDTARLSFTADTLPPGDPDVTHVFSLVVTDNADAESVADTVTVTVRSMNLSPVAAVGPDRTVQSGETVTLDASRSYDRDGTIVRFAWIGNVVGPGNIKLPLENADTATPGFMAPALAPGDEDLRRLCSRIVLILIIP